jgi:hypothetical protein
MTERSRTDIPEIVDQYLDMMRLAPERLVYVLLDRDDVVTRWGGDLDLLAGRRLLVGEPVADQLVGLVGILPIAQSSTVVPNLEIEPGVIVNLHAISSPVGGCLLLLDASAEHGEKQAKQQRRYDEKLAERSKRKR